MAKDKEFEKKYKENYKRKRYIHCLKRYEKYVSLARKANEYGCPLAGAKGNCWADPSSPTGYKQICSWQGTCESPCNGDC